MARRNEDASQTHTNSFEDVCSQCTFRTKGHPAQLNLDIHCIHRVSQDERSFEDACPHYPRIGLTQYICIDACLLDHFVLSGEEPYVFFSFSYDYDVHINVLLLIIRQYF